jgi:hypothetical protein
VHAGGIVLELEVHELLELREPDDLRKARQRLRLRDAEQRRVDDDVVARGQLGIETDSELDERRHSSPNGDLAAVAAVDAREALEKRALAGAVPPDDAEELARMHREGDALERVKLRRGTRATGMEHPLLQGRRTVVR